MVSCSFEHIGESSEALYVSGFGAGSPKTCVGVAHWCILREPDTYPGWFNVKTQLKLNRLKTHVEPLKTREPSDPTNRRNPGSYKNQNFVDKIIIFSLFLTYILFCLSQIATKIEFCN